MPPFGTRSDQPVVHQGDTTELRVYAYTDDEQIVSSDNLVAVNFTIKYPDGTEAVRTGDIDDDGAGTLLWEDTEQTGLYLWVAQFTFDTGAKTSYRNEFRVDDPLELPPQTRRSKIVDDVWLRLEDCFDSDIGGPWLRDMTLSWFEPSKIERFIDEGLVYINNWPPLTNFTLADFTTPIADPDPALPPGSKQDDPDRILIVQATLIATIKHLMRSYVEQPLPQGANIVWQSKRDYLERWNTILQIEMAFFHDIVALWKRQFYNYGKSALLVGNKAGRLGYGTGFRARNAARGVF